MTKYDESFYVEKEIAAPAERVWAVMATPAGLTQWHPFMATHTAERWDGVGSKDQLTYYSGLVWDREVMNWLEGTGFDLKVTRNGKQESWAIWRVTPIDDGNCVLRITGRVEYIKKLPFPIRWALLKFKMKPVFSRYLRQILEGFAHYAETGERVTRNQFGPHSFFSPEL